jgi:hypothetical protein
VIGGTSGVSNGFSDSSPRSPAVLDIFLCHDLPFPTMVRLENGDKGAHSTSEAEKQIPMNFFG